MSLRVGLPLSQDPHSRLGLVSVSYLIWAFKVEPRGIVTEWEGALRVACDTRRSTLSNQHLLLNSFNHFNIAGMPRRPPAVDDYASAVPHVSPQQFKLSPKQCANLPPRSSSLPQMPSSSTS
jgi:hypothetical protein